MLIEKTIQKLSEADDSQVALGVSLFVVCYFAAYIAVRFFC